MNRIVKITALGFALAAAAFVLTTIGSAGSFAPSGALSFTSAVLRGPGLPRG
jgi:hypothetical protein